MDYDHFLTPTEVRTYIGSNNTSLGDILEKIPDSRQNAKEITCLAEAKVVDSDYTVDASKVRVIFYCDVCNLPRCIYSKKAIGKPNGHSKLQAFVLDKWTKSGYTCE